MNEKEAEAAGVSYVEWYDNIDSWCSECEHGPKWHKIESDGCGRMIDGWCQCLRVWTRDGRYELQYLTT